MATWTLLLMANPKETDSGSGQVAELTRATGRKLGFSLVDAATLSFSMPGRHWQTAAIVPLSSDVLVFRDSTVVQRFRVVSRVLSKGEDGVLVASFTAVSYRALLDGRILHDTDTRSFTAVEQTAIAWTLINDSQTKSSGSLGIVRGIEPDVDVPRTLAGSATTGEREDFWIAGKKIGEAIRELSEYQNGFDWDIEPDPLNPYTGLLFNAWNLGDRSAHDPRSELLLDDGGSVLGYSHTATPSEYGNVLRFTGASPTDENTVGASALPKWVPTRSGSPLVSNPAGDPPEGRWERSLGDTDLSTQAAVDARGPQLYDEINLYVPEFAVDLARGRWDGPSHLWLGDMARVLVTEPVTEPFDVLSDQEYVLYLDEDMRVFEVSITVDDVGAEDVQVSLNRTRFSAKTNNRTLADRLTRLERR